MMTEFGGAVAVPRAVLNRESTTTMRVNDVIMIRIDGAIESTVNSAINWIARSVTPPLPWPRLILISCAKPGSASDPAAIRVAKNKTLRGNAGGLTKGSLDGPAMTPSRLRDSQSRSSAERGQEREEEQERAPRCAPGGQAEIPGQLAAQPFHQKGGAALLPAVAPSRRDSGRRTARIRMEEEPAAPAVSARRHVRARGSAATPLAARLREAAWESKAQ